MAAPRRLQACPCLAVTSRDGPESEADSAKRAEGARPSMRRKPTL